jgi:hypothetical protein
MCCALVALSLAGRAHAADKAADVEARRHFEEGLKHYNVGEFLEAAKEYTAAYKARPSSVMLYNIAQAYRLGNDSQQALFFYRSYLRNVPGAINRHEVEERIGRLEAQLAAGGPPTPTPSPTPPPPPLVPPTTGTGTVTPSPPAPAATPADPAVLVARPDDSAPAPASPRSPTWRKWWVWTLVGVGVAGAAVGVGVGLGLRSEPPSTHFGATMVQF